MVLIQLILYIFLATDSLTCPYSQLIVHNVIIIVRKGKAIPLQARKSPEGSRRLRLPDFKTIGT